MDRNRWPECVGIRKTKITDSERRFRANEWFEKGKKHLLNEENDAALNAFTWAIDFDPDNGRAYALRGFAYVLKDQCEKAIPDLRKGCNLGQEIACMANKGFVLKVELGPLYDHGLEFIQKKQFDNAIKEFTKAVNLKPSYAGAYYIRGRRYYEKGQFDEAIEDYNKAIAIASKNVVDIFDKLVLSDYFFGRGNAYAARSQIGEAMSDFERACNLGNKDGCKKAKTPSRNK